jgi:hypothetical protein
VTRVKLENGKAIDLPIQLSETQYAEIVVRGVVTVGPAGTKIDARHIHVGGRPKEHRLLALWPPQFRLFVSGGAEKHEHVFGQVFARTLAGKPAQLLFDVAPFQKTGEYQGAVSGELSAADLLKKIYL